MHMPASAMEECPWLTRGTAATVLDGAVSLAVNMPNQSEGSCLFHNRQRPREMLEITVGSTLPRACKKESARLTGVANWATECGLTRSHHHYTETIFGQARNTYFTVTLSLRGRKKRRARDQALEHIAETVAGNLY